MVQGCEGWVGEDDVPEGTELKFGSEDSSDREGRVGRGGVGKGERGGEEASEEEGERGRD